MKKAITLPKRFLSRTEAAWVYNTSVDVLEKIDPSELPYRKLGARSIDYDVQDLEAYFARFREDGGAAPKREPITALTIPAESSHAA